MQLESELNDERRRGSEVVDHAARVVHPPDRHVLDGNAATVEPPGGRFRTRRFDLRFAVGDLLGQDRSDLSLRRLAVGAGDGRR